MATSFALLNADVYNATTEVMGFPDDFGTTQIPYSNTSWYGQVTTEILQAPNSDRLGISESDIRRFSDVTKTFVNPLLSIIGFVGNSLGFGVLQRQAKQHKLSVFWYLAALTIMDVVFLGSGIINAIHAVVKPFDHNLSKYLVAHFRLGLTYVDNILLHTARMLVLVMSCERLISVARPLHVKNTWLAKYPLQVILVCLFFNCCFSLPFLVNGTVVKFNVRNNTEYVFTFKNYNTFMTHFWVAEATVHTFIPSVLLIAINIAIPIEFYKAAAKRTDLTGRSSDASSQQKKITATVMAVTIMNILLSIPIMVVKLLQFVNPDYNMHGRHRLVFWFLADLSKCLAYVNAANDFIIFFLVSNNYRALFMSMYVARCCRQPKSQKKYVAGASKTDSTETVSSTVSSSTKVDGLVHNTK